MNGPVSLLHPVGREEVGDAGQLMEELVLEAKDGCRPDNGGFRVYRSRDFFSPSLYSLDGPNHGKRMHTFVRKNSDAESLFAL